MKKGIVFGVFDGLHEGHKHFLSAAAGKCEELTIVVATDAAARALKGRAPAFPLEERMNAIRAFNSALTVRAGDDEQGSWKVLEENPDVVMLGYDQGAIAQELAARGIPFIYLGAHEPHRFKSSILQAKKPEGGEGS